MSLAATLQVTYVAIGPFVVKLKACSAANVCDEHEQLIIVRDVDGVPARLVSPASGSILGPGFTTFIWDRPSRVDRFRIAIGTSEGGSDVYAAETSATAVTANLSNATGRVFVELRSRTGTDWLLSRYEFPVLRVVPSTLAVLTPPYGWAADERLCGDNREHGVAATDCFARADRRTGRVALAASSKSFALAFGDAQSTGRAEFREWFQPTRSGYYTISPHLALRGLNFHAAGALVGCNGDQIVLVVNVRVTDVRSGRTVASSTTRPVDRTDWVSRCLVDSIVQLTTRGGHVGKLGQIATVGHYLDYLDAIETMIGDTNDALVNFDQAVPVDAQLIASRPYRVSVEVLAYARAGAVGLGGQMSVILIGGPSRFESALTGVIIRRLR